MADSNGTTSVSESASPTASPSPTVTQTRIGSPTPTKSETPKPSPGPTDITVPATPLSDAELKACAERTDGLKTVILDPGHSGEDDDGKAHDPISGLDTHDYPNVPEIDEMWNVAQLTESALCTAGYKVVLTKDSARDTKTLPEKIKIGLDAKPDLAVSIHDDHSQALGTGNDVYVQSEGQWRGGTAEEPAYTCNNPDIAAASKAAGDVFVKTRTKVEGTEAKIGTVNLENRPGLQPGNTWFTQLDACNPGPDYQPAVWIYNEMGAKADGNEKTELTAAQKSAYAQGLASSIAKVLEG